MIDPLLLETIDPVQLLARFNTEPPAEETAIAESEQRLGIALPPDYRSFLKFVNGGEGFIGDTYLILWGAGNWLLSMTVISRHIGLRDL